MTNNVADQDSARRIFVRQYEYFQYLFEQEQKRAASIVAGARVYIAFLVFILGSVFLKLIPLDTILTPFGGRGIGSPVTFIGASLITLSALALASAVVFTILVLKVWSYDRLCDPLDRYEKTLTMTSEMEVLSKAIADFAVATSRNNRINNKRAEYLTRGLYSLLAGITLSMAGGLVLNLTI